MSALKVVLLLAALGYVAVVGLIFFTQTSILFPARYASGILPLPAGGQRLSLKTREGIQLNGIHIAPAGGGAAVGAPVILGFGGNAWNAEDCAAYLHGLYPRHHVVAFHYRGYAPSGGKPSAAALLADAPLIYDDVVKQLGTNRIVATGFSIGSGVAAHLASKRELAGVILVTPFDTLGRVAGAHYRWLPTGLLLRHHMRPIEDLHANRTPTAIIVAERDTLIPPPRAEALAAAVPNLVLNRTIRGAGHNDIYQNPEFRAAMAEAVNLIAR